jgi:hypothetical protein
MIVVGVQSDDVEGKLPLLGAVLIMACDESAEPQQLGLGFVRQPGKLASTLTR